MPFVVVLQHDLARLGRGIVVAPLAPSPGGARQPVHEAGYKLLVPVTMAGEPWLVVIPEIRPVAVTALKGSVGDLQAHAADLLAAIDFLFTGC